MGIMAHHRRTACLHCPFLTQLPAMRALPLPAFLPPAFGHMTLPSPFLHAAHCTSLTRPSIASPSCGPDPHPEPCPWPPSARLPPHLSLRDILFAPVTRNGQPIPPHATPLLASAGPLTPHSTRPHPTPPHRTPRLHAAPTPHVPCSTTTEPSGALVRSSTMPLKSRPTVSASKYLEEGTK